MLFPVLHCPDPPGFSSLAESTDWKEGVIYTEILQLQLVSDPSEPLRHPGGAKTTCPPSQIYAHQAEKRRDVERVKKGLITNVSTMRRGIRKNQLSLLINTTNYRLLCFIYGLINRMKLRRR
jgi:hypothetical protein